VIKDFTTLDSPFKNAGAGAFAGAVSVLLFQVSTPSLHPTR
jgi:hypothetical protein